MSSWPTICAAVVGDELAGPFRRDLAEIVVGGDDVDLLAVLLHHPRDERRELLLGQPARADHVAVADAAFVLVGVEVEHVAVVDDRADGLARGAGGAGEQHVDLVPVEQPAGEFLEVRVVELRIVGDQLELPPGDAAGLVDLLDGELRAAHLRQGEERDLAGLVFEQADLDRRLVSGLRGGQRESGDSSQQRTKFDGHFDLRICDVTKAGCNHYASTTPTKSAVLSASAQGRCRRS